MECNPPGSSVYRISQARILTWIAISFSRTLGYSDPGIFCTGRWILYHGDTWEALVVISFLSFVDYDCL